MDFVLDWTHYNQPCKSINSNFYPSARLGNVGKRDNAHFSFHLTNLKFVSCGNTSLSGIEAAFVNIVSIFEIRLWLCIASSYIILALLVNYKLASSNYRRQNSLLLGLLKILLEQGDPIKESLLIFSLATRIVFVVALFGGLVLSTLFKNENITLITLPRQPKVLFDTLDNLIDNNFKIYTRATFLGISNIRISSILNTAPQTRHLLRLIEPTVNNSDHSFSNVFYSELYTYGKAENSWLNILGWMTAETFSAKVTRLMNHTKLLQNWMETLLNFNKVDNDLMKDCNRTAVLLPDFAAHEYYYNLKRKKKSAFLGNGLQMSMSYGIKFSRRVNPQVLVRMQGLYSAGLWDWWTKVMVDFMPRIQGGFINDRISPWKASDLNGNIVVVFVIYCAGILTGIFVWILEVNFLLRLATCIKKFIKFRHRLCFNKNN